MRAIRVVGIFDNILKCYLIHRDGGTNWMATITPSDEYACGYNRDFWLFANTPHGTFIVPNNVAVYDVVEAGGDEKKSGLANKDKYRDRLRSCFVVLAVDDTQIVVEEYRSGLAAISAAARYKSGEAVPPAINQMSPDCVNEIVLKVRLDGDKWVALNGDTFTEAPSTMIMSGSVWFLSHMSRNEAIALWHYERQPSNE